MGTSLNGIGVRYALADFTADSYVQHIVLVGSGWFSKSARLRPTWAPAWEVIVWDDRRIENEVQRDMCIVVS